MTTKAIIAALILFFPWTCFSQVFKSMRTSTSGIVMPTGAAAFMGTATLSAGTAVVNTAAIKTTSIVILSPVNGTLNIGAVSISARTEGVSFTILSSNTLDARDISWMIFESE